ncbi:DUF5713 family protein [Tepidibacter hydrothermalis]|uniref:DUF5713 family protein n=1 Tax=Tepidibacter hydrothermalis TaxID=3036126 RepID=A0ABY8E9Z1_9FIRM|nr:DUF5713 family protein [Tepidibacter hydrothermalis]WFD09727.1 DUF5713 family protein [Tepidibacter hydrothermalis]
MKLLQDMYNDNYFPNNLVDKIKDEIEKVIKFIENGNSTLEELQNKLDEMTVAINDLEEEFEENGSELETVARESIADTVYLVLKKYKVDIDIETAIRKRNW